jgi:hypothetical protein
MLILTFCALVTHMSTEKELAYGMVVACDHFQIKRPMVLLISIVIVINILVFDCLYSFVEPKKIDGLVTG